MKPTYRLQHLRGRQLRVFLAVADQIVPPDESPGAGTLATAGVVDWALNRLDPELRGLFLKFLVLVDFMGVFFGGRTFTRNSRAAQERQLRWMESCPIAKLRMGFFGLKSYACMGYYTREDTWPSMHYGGPHVPDRPFPEPMIRDLERGTVEVVE